MHTAKWRPAYVPSLCDIKWRRLDKGDVVVLQNVLCFVLFDLVLCLINCVVLVICQAGCLFYSMIVF